MTPRVMLVSILRSYASEGGGQMWKSTAGDYVVLADAMTETNPGGFSIVSLLSGRRVSPDDNPTGRVFAAAPGSKRRVLMIVSEVEGFPGAAEVSAYRVDASKVALIGRRTFEAPYEGVFTSENQPADLDGCRIRRPAPAATARLLVPPPIRCAARRVRS